MEKMVKEFLDNQKNIEKEKYENEKNELLIALELYEKVYSPEDCYSDEYSWVEWDNENSKNKYYKKVAIKVSDEEYEMIKKYSENNNDCKKNENNNISRMLVLIAWAIYFIGIISGFIISEGSMAMMLFVWFTSFVGGTCYLAFAEIIKILVQIKNK